MNLLLQEFQPKEWGGLTSKNHLGYAYMIKPQEASKFVTMIYQANMGYTDLDTFLGQFPSIGLETDDEYTWDVMAGGERNIPLVKAYTGDINSPTEVTAATKTGVGFGEFYLEFPEYYFFDVNIIVGHKDEYQIQIIDDPIPYGSNYLNRCKLITGDPELFIPYEELQAGKRFSKQYSGVESTLSKKGGKIHFTSPFKMKNYFTRLRLEDTVPGNMIRRPIGVRFKNPNDPNGGMITAWEEYRDWQFELEFRQEKNHALYNSRLNRASDGTFKNKGKSGYEYEQGAGMRQQIESSNVEYYPTDSFDIKWLTNKLLDLSVNRLPQDRRRFIFRTGERGMVQFSEALEQYASLYTPLNDTSRVSMSGNSMTYQGQYLEFKGPQGIQVTVQHDPYKDNTVHNKDMHPDGGPVSSYEYDILDVGTVNGESNIVKVYQNGMQDIRGYEPGLRNPFSPTEQMTVMSTSTDGYTHHRMWIGGVMVKDPTRCMVIKPQIAA